MRRPRRSRGTFRIAAFRIAASASALRTAGDADVLLSVDHERNRRSQLRSMEVQIEELFARIGAERQQPVVHAGKYEIPSRRKTSARKWPGTRARRAPALFPGDRIPGVQNIARGPIR